jgi:hypothetical protein
LLPQNQLDIHPEITTKKATFQKVAFFCFPCIPRQQCDFAEKDFDSCGSEFMVILVLLDIWGNSN